MQANVGPMLDQLRRDAAKAAAERVGTAGREANGLRAIMQEEAAARWTAGMAAQELAAAVALEAARVTTAQRLEPDILAARAEALDRIFVHAAVHMETLAAHPRLGEVLGRAIADALTYLPDGPVTVRCCRSAAQTVRAALRALGRETDSIREDPTVALGAIVESADGGIAVDVTLARLLARRRRQLSIVLNQRIQGIAP